jgi:hypothetical protein
MTEKGMLLNVGERKILSNVYEAVTDQRVWRIRTNQELQELCKTPDLLVNIKRFGWSGWDI